jgi:hypothetical protein
MFACRSTTSPGTNRLDIPGLSICVPPIQAGMQRSQSLQ